MNGYSRIFEMRMKESSDSEPGLNGNRPISGKTGPGQWFVAMGRVIRKREPLPMVLCASIPFSSSTTRIFIGTNCFLRNAFIIRFRDVKSSLGRLFRLQIEMDRGRKDERKHHRAQDSSYDGDSQGFQHGGTSTDAERQRKHAGDGGQRRHGDGTQPAAPGLDHGVFRGIAEVAEVMPGVEQENAV